jgi:vacuolar-type H+-ATPase subunit F/Vma7
MGRVVALGEQVRVGGFALAGSHVVAAEDAAAVRDAFRALPGDVAVVLLTPRAAAAVEDLLVDPSPDAPLTVVLPP